MGRHLYPRVMNQQTLTVQLNGLTSSMETEMVSDDIKEYNLEEFSEVTFRWSYTALEAATDEETVSLYTGMPIWSVYFYDLTGDGHSDICSTISCGSGMIDNRIIIYDYIEGAG